jgi:hypothetical protein
MIHVCNCLNWCPGPKSQPIVRVKKTNSGSGLTISNTGLEGSGNQSTQFMKNVCESNITNIYFTGSVAGIFNSAIISKLKWSLFVKWDWMGGRGMGHQHYSWKPSAGGAIKSVRRWRSNFDPKNRAEEPHSEECNSGQVLARGVKLWRRTNAIEVYKSWKFQLPAMLQRRDIEAQKGPKTCKNCQKNEKSEKIWKKCFLVEVKNAFSGMVKSGGCEKNTF